MTTLRALHRATLGIGLARMHPLPSHDSSDVAGLCADVQCRPTTRGLRKHITNTNQRVRCRLLASLHHEGTDAHHHVKVACNRWACKRAFPPEVSRVSTGTSFLLHLLYPTKAVL